MVWWKKQQTVMAARLVVSQNGGRHDCPNKNEPGMLPRDFPLYAEHTHGCLEYFGRRPVKNIRLPSVINLVFCPNLSAAIRSTSAPRLRTPQRWPAKYFPQRTGVKHCKFHWFVSYVIVQKLRVLSSLRIHHLIMITCISYGNIFAALVPKCINIAAL